MTDSRQDFIYRKLSAMIFSGQLAPGDRLPNEPDLSRKFGVARVTLRSALKRLENEGIVSRSRSGGTVVRLEKSAAPKVLLVSQLNSACPMEAPIPYLNPGIERRCRELGWEIEYLPPEFIPETLPVERGFFGIILTGHNYNGNEPWLRIIRKSGLPAVCAHGFHSDPTITKLATVVVDIQNAWRDGLRHLIRFGHRRIALLLRNDQLVFQRMGQTPDSMRRLLEEEGACADPVLIFHPDDCGFGAVVDRIFRMSDPPTAIYCYSDFFAVEVYAELRERKIRIPDDIAVMGFCGFPGSALMRPPLSTVDFKYECIGAMAVDLLARRDEWENDPVKPVVRAPYDILPRASTDKFLLTLKGDKK